MTTHASSPDRAEGSRADAALFVRALLVAVLALSMVTACTYTGRRGYATRYPDKPYQYDAYNPGYDPYYDPYRMDEAAYGRDPYGRRPYDRDRVYVQPR